ncbi:hypothetical protein [Streptomyces sp. NBC_00648]|uniref:hypothetical protein n=1 Tax=Streptomyces sp. NBC_00648 TaxID=2975797 RepID=UPI00324A55C9
MPPDTRNERHLTSDGPEQYRLCEICREPGAEVITRMVIGEVGGDHTSYAHRGCAEVVPS